MPRTPGKSDKPTLGGNAAKRLQMFEQARAFSSEDSAALTREAGLPAAIAAQAVMGATRGEPFAQWARTAKPRPPGGKPLQRLMLFNDARGFTSDMPAGLTRAQTAAPGFAARALANESGGAHPQAKIAQMYADAARALKSESNGSRQAQTATSPDATPGHDPVPAGVPAATAWRSLGPIVMPNGQTYGAARVDVAGRVAAIAIDPSNTNHILVGAAGGGVWESRDRGANWAPRTDTMPTLTVGALAFDPSAPATVYCGTGEGNFYAGLGAGLLRSTNGGANWALRAGAPFVGQGFYDLIVNPSNGNHILAACSSGVYVSTDAGLSWIQRRNMQCWDLSMRRVGRAGQEILAACQDGLFRSVDGGVTWTAVRLPGSPGSFGRLAVCHAPSDGNVAYVFGSGGPDIQIPGDPNPTHTMPTPYLWRRPTAAGDFTAATPPMTPPVVLTTGQAWYDWFLGVSPDNPNQIYLGAIDVFRGELSGGAWTWADISSRQSGDSIHPDQHAIAFEPGNPAVVYVGCDGGLYRSPNRGANWTALNRGLAITEIEYMAQDYGSSRWLIAGTQDNGSTRYTGSAVWEHVADGDGGDCGVNRADPNVVFHSYYYMGMERSTANGAFGTFGWIGPNVPEEYRKLFYPPMEVCNTTVAQAGQSVFVSRDNGSNFTEIALPGSALASAMAVPTPDQLIVGTTDGRLFRLTWNGTAWSGPSPLATPRTNAWVSDIDCDPANLNRIWVTYSSLGGGRVFRSDNGGTTWLDRSAGLSALPMNAVEVDPANNNRVWVCADIGVFQSFNSGDSWTAMSTGLPNVLVEDLVFHPHARVLRAGTRNRGVWEYPVDGWMTSPVCGTQFNGTIAAGGTAQWFTFNWPATWHVLWTIMPTTPRPGGPELKWSTRVERANAEFVTYWIRVTNLTPVTVAFEGRFCILSKY
jgi:photosystem II stability/assembly factor-like uncharacterized protein